MLKNFTKIVLGIILIIFICIQVYAFDTTSEKEYNDLLKDVNLIELQGVPCSLTVYGPSSYPLFIDSDGQTTAALISNKKQHALIFSHDAWLKKTNWQNTAVDNFITNSLNWIVPIALEKAKSSSLKEIKILVYRAPDIADRFKKLILSKPTIYKNFSIDSPAIIPKDLSSYAAIIMYLPTETDQNFDKNTIKSLETAFINGTPFISAGIGWVYMTYGDGKKGYDLYSDFSGNIIFSKQGVVFENRYAKQILQTIKLNQANTDLKTFLETVFLSLENISDSSNLLDKNMPNRLWKEAYGILDWEMVAGKERLDNLLEKLKQSSSKLVPLTQNPIQKTDIKTRTAIVFLELVSRRHPEKCLWLYPLIGEFPGIMQKKIDAESIRQLAISHITISTNQLRWQTLGLWVNAGDTIRVSIEGMAPGTKALLLLGAHTDELVNSDLMQWERWPVIHDVFHINDEWQELICRKSGPLYIQIPDAVINESTHKSKTYNIQISGTLAMPVWSKAIPTTDFLQEVSTSTCPMVELIGDNIIFTQERLSLPDNFNAAKIMEFWDKAAGLVPDLIGIKNTAWKQRFVADRQILAGYMHAGYPIMSHLDVSEYQMGSPGIKAKVKDMQNESVLISGAWGHFHELGHNFQNTSWTFNDGSEVTVNLFTLYIMEVLIGKKPLSHAHLKENASAARKYLEKPVWKDWAKNPFVALYTYAVPAEEFGWEVYKKTFQKYTFLSENEKPKTDQDKLDTWVKLYSLSLGKNVSPWFKRWGAPVSAKIEMELKHLKPWSGPNKWKL